MTETSHLPEIARLEQSEVEKTETLIARCKERVDEAREQVQSELAAIPTKVQEERRRTAQEAKDKAAEQVSGITQEAESKEAQIAAALPELEDQVLEIVLSTILPSESEVDS